MKENKLKENERNKTNFFQDTCKDLLFTLYKNFRKKIFDERSSKKYNDFFHAFNYIISNAMLSHYAVRYQNENGEILDVEHLEKFTIDSASNILFTKEAYNGYGKIVKRNNNRILFFEHITPKSVIYRKLINIFTNEKELNCEGFLEKVNSIFDKHKVLVMLREPENNTGEEQIAERLFLDASWDTLCSKTNIDKSEDADTLKTLKPFMRSDSEPLLRLYFLYLINKDSFLTYYLNGEAIDILEQLKIDENKFKTAIENLPEIKKQSKTDDNLLYLRDEDFGISLNDGVLKKYFSNDYSGSFIQMYK